MSKKFFSALFGAMLAGIAAGLFLLSLEPKGPPIRPKVTPIFTLAPQSRLKEVVDSALSGSQGTYGIVVTNLKTGETYGVNPDRSFNCASLYKLWVMAEAYDQIASGDLDKDEVLGRDVAQLNSEFSIASEEAELTEGMVTLTVGQAIKQMITISHNYAALLLSERVGLSNVTAFLNDHGLTQSKLGEPPQTTAADTALFFQKLYRGELANETYTSEMLDVLKGQTLNSKIPRNLPSEIPVAHKTGEIDYLSHDAGIVFGKKGDYIITILSESDYPPGAQERIGEISLAVYNYFASL